MVFRLDEDDPRGVDDRESEPCKLEEDETEVEEWVG